MKKYFAIIITFGVFVFGCNKDNSSNNNPNNSTVGNGYPPPTCNCGPPVKAFAVFNGNLIAGGYSGIEGHTNESILQWNGSSWSSLGKGVNGNINAMIIYNGNLVVAGAFDSAGGISSSYIAQWNGSSWSSLGSGIHKHFTLTTVNALIVYNGSLIVGGFFDSAGSVQVNAIAQWNGATWDTLNNATTGFGVASFVIYNGNLIAAIGPYVEQFNGISWDTLGTNWVDAKNLTIFNGNLIATENNAIEEWNGSSWTSMSDSIELPNATFVYNGNLYAETTASNGGNQYPSCYFYLWNGTYWRREANEFVACPGNTPFLSCFTIYNGNLIAGGLFIPNGIFSYNGSTWTSF